MWRAVAAKAGENSAASQVNVHWEMHETVLHVHNLYSRRGKTRKKNDF
jgi:hypothetical protein